MRRCRSALVQLVSGHIVAASMKYPLFEMRCKDLVVEGELDTKMGLHIKSLDNQNSVVIFSTDPHQGDIRVEYYRTCRAFSVYYGNVTLSGAGLKENENESRAYTDLLVSDGSITARLNDLGVKVMEFLLTGKIGE